MNYGKDYKPQFMDFFRVLLWTFMESFGLLSTFMDILWILMDFYGLLSEFWEISIFDQKKMQCLFKVLNMA